MPSRLDASRRPALLRSGLVDDLSDRSRPRFGSAAASAFHAPGQGDVILAVNDVTVADVAAFDDALAAVRASGRPVALLVQRGAALGYLAVGPTPDE